MSITQIISDSIFGDKEFLRFQYAFALYGLFVLALIVVIFIWSRKNQKKKLSIFSNPALIKSIIPKLSYRKAKLRFIIWSSALFFLVLGLANLQFGDKKETVARAGIDLMICLDVSKSMMAEDIKPYRLKRAKLAISQIINQLGSDRVGIILFAGDAYLQLPLTNDHAASQMYLENVTTDFIPIQGTNISSAIELAISSFPENSPTNKAIIIISDGENHDGIAITKAEEAADKEIKVFTVGLGSEQGAPIPEYINGRKNGVKKDRNGSTVITRLNQAALADIAKAGKGIYVHGTTSSLGLDQLLQQIGNIEKAEYETKEFTSYNSKFQTFLLLGLGLLILEFVILKRTSTWLKK